MTEENVYLGMVVARGPDWNDGIFQKEDVFPGNFGIVKNIYSNDTRFWVYVRWDKTLDNKSYRLDGEFKKVLQPYKYKEGQKVKFRTLEDIKNIPNQDRKYDLNNLMPKEYFGSNNEYVIEEIHDDEDLEIGGHYFDPKWVVPVTPDDVFEKDVKTHEEISEEWYEPTRLEDFVDGQEFIATIRGLDCRGLVSVNDYFILLCQDRVPGNNRGDRKGFMYSWACWNLVHGNQVFSSISNLKLKRTIKSKTNNNNGWKKDNQNTNQNDGKSKSGNSCERGEGRVLNISTTTSTFAKGGKSGRALSLSKK